MMLKFLFDLLANVASQSCLGASAVVY